MGINERKREIVESLNQHNGFASINYLSKKLYASRSTIRRDLMSLEEDGILKRSHGYVSLVVKSAKESPISMRQIENLDKKQIIARKMEPLIKDGMVIFLDSSCTLPSSPMASILPMNYPMRKTLPAFFVRAF